MDIARLKELSGIKTIVEAADKFEAAENAILDSIERKIRFTEVMSGVESLTKTLEEIKGLVDQLISTNQKEKTSKSTGEKESREPAEDRVYQDMSRRIEQAIGSGDRSVFADTLKVLKADLAKLREIQRAEIKAGNERQKVAKEAPKE